MIPITYKEFREMIEASRNSIAQTTGLEPCIGKSYVKPTFYKSGSVMVL